MLERDNLKLLNIERQFGKKQQDWEEVRKEVQSLWSLHLDDVEVVIRILYILHNILVEELYTDNEAILLEALFKEYYDISYEKYRENAEYLFFIGTILHICEWYFGIDEGMNSVDKTLAFQMQEKARVKEPDNKLYQWAIKFSLGEKNEAYLLAKELLWGDAFYLVWLQKKGFAGDYIIHRIKYSYNRVFDQ